MLLHLFAVLLGHRSRDELLKGLSVVDAVKDAIAVLQVIEVEADVEYDTHAGEGAEVHH